MGWGRDEGGDRDRDGLEDAACWLLTCRMVQQIKIGGQLLAAGKARKQPLSEPPGGGQHA